jgi:hypothetical protein
LCFQPAKEKSGARRVFLPAVDFVEGISLVLLRPQGDARSARFFARKARRLLRVACDSGAKG